MTPDQWIDFEEMLTPEQCAELGLSQDRSLSQCLVRLAGAYRAEVDRLAKATADTKRLNWLENRPCNSFASLGIDYSHEERVYRTDAINGEGVHPSLRAAIDAARK